MRKTSDNGVAFVAREEGEVLHVYKDVAGVATIGVGHVVRPGESFPALGITHEQALELLREDLAVAEYAVNSHVTVPISQNAFDALVSFTFNCGGGALVQSSILAFLNRGDMESAARGFLLWDKRKDPKTGSLVVDSGLLGRRGRERDLFLKPDDDDNPY